jgi:oligopeptide/dipeptide ABC transporter ATP-binding protein
LAARSLVKHFGTHRKLLRAGGRSVRAVEGVSFEIEPGTTLGLVGESGSGKTTVGRLLLHLLEPSSGEIYFDIPTDLLQTIDTDRTAEHGQTEGIRRQYALGSTKQGIRRLRRMAQMVFQDPFSSLDPRMLVRDIVAEPLIALKIAREADPEETVSQTLEDVGLSPEDMFRFPHEFSGGQRQRIGIARAIVADPRFIVLDEPTSALDVSVQAQTLNLLRRLQRISGLSYLFISHDFSVIDHMSDRIAVMYAGKIVEIADTIEFFRRPLHPYSEALLSVIPIPDPERRRTKVVLGGDVPSPESPPPGCRFHPRCPYAIPVCSQVEPLLEDKGGGHLVACHVR